MLFTLEQQENIVVVKLNRPEALNALSSKLARKLIRSLRKLDNSPDVGCFVITGSESVFAAGADIKEMKDKTLTDMNQMDFFSEWDAFTALRTPKIAAVAGPALGGGCELAMMCDLIFAADNARFGQPEIKLGVIPGIGGTQRLTKLVGKTRAMDMILTGKIIDAVEAERIGLVSRVLPGDQLMPITLETAKTIANYSKPAVIAAKETVDRALEVSLREGILFERRVFHGLFASEDQKEGMQAFSEKRKPEFKGK